MFIMLCSIVYDEGIGLLDAPMGFGLTHKFMIYGYKKSSHQLNINLVTKSGFSKTQLQQSIPSVLRVAKIDVLLYF